MACSNCGYSPSQDRPLVLPVLSENIPPTSTEIPQYLSIGRARLGVLTQRIERVERALDVLCACREYAQTALVKEMNDQKQLEDGIKVEFREFFPESREVSHILQLDASNI